MAVAYDYEAQEWVEGEAATVVLRRYLREELDLLVSYRGTEYARMLGVEVDAAIIRANDALAALEGTEA